MSELALRRAIGVLAITGMAISGYLTYVHFAEVEPVCTAFSDCVRVQASDQAVIAGLPVALLGLVGYAAILLTTLRPGEGAALAGALLAYVAVGFSAYLTWVELVEIHAICQWCVASAVNASALAVLCTLRVVRSPRVAAPA